MTEDIRLRFHLVDRLMRLRYGDTMGIDADQAHMAWPPTGDADHSMEGAFRAMALASGGNRPETTYTTAERIANDLDDSFAPPEFIDYAQPRVWKIHRKVSACPHCRGTGWTRIYPRNEVLDLAVGDGMIRVTDTVTVKTVKCDHHPV
jgi:hypothetical protein